jgi:GNAT superfamily N-acetyltransferase
MSASRRELYRQVAALHVANIDQGFLSTLGVRFVALLYRAIDECEDSSFFVEDSEGRVVGFVSGATGMGPIYRRMLHYWPALLTSLFPSMFNPRCLRRILEILKYSRGHQTIGGLPSAELRSIAVDRAYRGQHRADFLYRRLANYFRDEGNVAFKIIVGKALVPAHKFYARMGAVPITEVSVHKGELSTVYVQRLE